MSANRLACESSPYLRQHADNPVDWFPWGAEAFAKARAEQKPIFLSIGYSTCHWCHVMAHECFENAAVAERLNAHFVSIKVDREERPDIDRLYMTAVQATTGRGGWPMSVWLTPDRKPFYCGTYFPRPSFLMLLERIHAVWMEHRDGILEQARQLTEELQARLTWHELVTETPFDETPLHACYQHLAATYDPIHAGFGHAPKFPHPVTLDFLFRYYARTGTTAARDMALHQLRVMANGGIHDQLGGGFHRYSVDERWLVSHFEKMLYDQALLIGRYLDAAQLTGESFYREIAERTADYVLRDLTSPDGVFYSAEDADSEGVEGKFYVWTWDEIEAVLGPDTDAFAQSHGVTRAGNWERGLNVLHVTGSDTSGRTKLLAARNQRVRPHRDEKVLTSWNGLMMSALARLGRVSAAERAANYLLNHHRRQGRLWRTPTVPALLEDYAFLATGLLDLYEATLLPTWRMRAQELADQMLDYFFHSERGGFYQTDGTDASLLIRSKDDYDGAEPAGNSMAALLLLRLDGERYRAAAEQTVRCFWDRLSHAPYALPQMLGALDWLLSAPVRVTLAGETESFRRVLAARYLPNCIVVGEAGQTHARVCVGTTCQLPVKEPSALARQLDLLKR